MITRRARGGGDGHFVVTFTVPAKHDDGRRISVVGEFNCWNPHAAPMVLTGGGTWTATVDLLPGRYRFRYLTDQGRWFNDPTADGHEDNEYGGQESVLDLAPESDSR